MSIFEKICIILAVPLGAILMILGALGLFLGCSFNFTLPPILGGVPFLVGYGICVCLVKYWKLVNVGDKMSYESVRHLQTYSTRFEAESAQGVLKQNGIYCIVQGDDCAGMMPHVGLTSGGFKLLVKESDMSQARELLGIS